MERFKNIPIRKPHIYELEYSTLYKIKKCYRNFNLIIKHDYIVKDLRSKMMSGKLTKKEYKELLIAHISYYYDINIEKEYGTYFRRYYKNRKKGRY